MGLDTNIALSVRPPVDPLESFSKVMSLKNIANQQQIDQIKLDQAMQDQEQQRTLADLYRGAYSSDGKLDRNALMAGAAQRGLGARIPALQKQFADADKAQVDVDNTRSQMSERDYGVLRKRVDATNGMFTALLSKPDVTHEDVIRGLVGLRNQKVINDDEAVTALRDVPGDPVQLRQFLVEKAVQSQEAGKRLDAVTPKFEKLDNGGAIQMGTVDQLTGQFTPGQAIRKVQTPDSVASNATTMRGQNLTDARARDRLAFDKEQAGFANGAGGALTLPGFGKAPPGYMWDATTSPPSLKSIKGGPADSGAKPSAEVQRQLGGVISFDKDLSALEAALKDFNPRDPRDQADTTKRARIQSLSKQAQLSAKEAAALGALSGPDMMLLEGILNDPTSWKGATAGGSGIAAQIAEARAGNRRRVESLQQQYGPRVTEGLSANLQPGAQATAPPATDWSQAGYKTQAQAVQDARSAILKGADKAAVVQRLEALGIANHGIK